MSQLYSSHFCSYGIQSSAVITRSNLSRCYIRRYDDSTRTQIRLQTHNRHTYSLPSRASYGLSIMGILKKIDRVITALYCIMDSVPSGQHACLSAWHGKFNLIISVESFQNNVVPVRFLLWFVVIWLVLVYRYPSQRSDAFIDASVVY